MSTQVQTHEETIVFRAQIAADGIPDTSEVNVGERPEPTLFGSYACQKPPADDGGLTANPETNRSDDIHHVHHIHLKGERLSEPGVEPDEAETPPPDPDDDILGDATDPQGEEIAKAVAVIESAIDGSADNPGLLAKDEFNQAVKLLREDAPDEWFALRGRVKSACKAAGLKLGDIEQATRPPGEDDDRTTVADEVVDLVRKMADLFHATDGTCYAALNDQALTYRLDTRAWEEWASFAFYQSTATDTAPGMAASDTALRTARTVLTGIAKHEGDERKVYLRAAYHQGLYYLDLGTANGSAVEITAAGWRIVARPPVHFWRTSTMRPLPLPVAGGDLSLLWQYANIPEAERPLVLACLMESLRPETPFPVLELTGQQGTAKSSTQDKLRRCTDPNAVNLRAAPKSVEDLFVSAGANWVASLNNLSHLSSAIQDALCSLATGGGFAGRTLYTNADESLIEAKRPVMLNGIVPLVTAQDLTDRVIHIELPELTTYRTETVIEAGFERDLPEIVGGLLDLFVLSLAALPSVKLERPPRMADFAALGEAMMLSAGHPHGAFLGIYLNNRHDSIGRSIEASPVACAVRQMVDEHRGESPIVFNDTMKNLLLALESHRDGGKAWPASPRGLGDALRRQRPALSQIGIGIEIGKAKKDGIHVTITRKPNTVTKTGELGEHGEHG